MIKLSFEPLVNTGMYVYFKGGWGETGKGEKVYRVRSVQRFSRYASKIIKRWSYDDFDLSNASGGLGMYPENMLSMYELAIGMKGDTLLYVRLPSTRYFNMLEKSGFEPAEDLSENKYVGPYTKADIPFDANPPVLRIVTVKNLDTIVLRAYADSFEDEKTVLRFVVNRCRLEEIKDADAIKAKASELQAEGRLKIIEDWRIIAGGAGE
ncbi:hypothetical protein J7L81_05135 [Candidatus Aerophobetes bacterium]|nr:hypothetical protein [Candidatus Aerophobetes bacterium]